MKIGNVSPGSSTQLLVVLYSQVYSNLMSRKNTQCKYSSGIVQLYGLWVGFLRAYVEYELASVEIRPRGYKTFFVLNSVEHEIFPAHKC